MLVIKAQNVAGFLADSLPVVSCSGAIPVIQVYRGVSEVRAAIPPQLGKPVVPVCTVVLIDVDAVQA
jgi:hypothetical protein